jgi:hypothetical protein
MGHGGAVELSWKLRPASSARNDKFVDCQLDPQEQVKEGWGAVTRILLRWKVGGTQGSRDWDCNENHGATGFDLAQGMAELSVVPECGDPPVPAAPETYITPATLEREVTRGEVVSLGAIELVVAVSSCRHATDPGASACICDTDLAIDHTSR